MWVEVHVARTNMKICDWLVSHSRRGDAPADLERVREG